MCVNTSGRPRAFAHPPTRFPHAHRVFPTLDPEDANMEAVDWLDVSWNRGVEGLITGGFLKMLSTEL